MLRFEVRAEDDLGNVDTIERTFVPTCTNGVCDVCLP